METSVKYASTIFSESYSVFKQNVKPILIGVQTIRVRAIFGHVAERLACLALSLSTPAWAESVVVPFWFFLAVTDTNGWVCNL
jgi:hypothetical protein